jgi:phosphoglycolate phosphatase-like HAD superfamily hydrolase
VSILDAHPVKCAFVGDSTTDMLAGRLAGAPVIG